MAGKVELATAYLTLVPSLKGVNESLQKELDPGKFSGVGRAVGMGLVAGIGAAVIGVGAILKTGTDEALDAAAGIAQLNAGIQSTGNVANVSVEGLSALASEIQNYSGQTDDSIVQTENLLLTFTNIRNVGPDKIFDQATMAAADMAAKFGGDASSQAIVLGKALNDPVNGLTALRRVGVAFTDAQQEQVKAMVAAGDTMGAQKLILGELTTEFGGAARAAGESLPGQLERGKRAFEDLSQSVVETFIPALAPIAEELPGMFQSIAPIVQGAAQGVAEAFVVVGGAVQAVTGFLSENQGVAIALAVVIGALTIAMAANAAITAVSAAGGLAAYIAGLSVVRGATTAWTAVQWLLNAALSANPIGIVIVVIAALVAAVIWAFNNVGWFRDAVTGAWQAISSTTMAVLGAVGAWFTGLWNGIVSFGVAVVQGYVGFLIGAWSNISGFTIGIFSGISGFFTGIWNGIVSFGIAVVSGYVGFILGAWSNISGFTIGIFSGIGSFIAGIWNGLVSGAVGAVSGVGSALASVPGRVMGALAGAGGWLLGVGRDIIAGLAQGILGAGGMIFDAVRSAVGNVVDFAKRILGIGSPSKVMRDEVGQWIPAGIGEGIRDNAGAAVDPLEELFNMPAYTRPIPNRAGAPVSAAPYSALQAPTRGPAGPQAVTLRVGEREFRAYLEDVADGRIDEAVGDASTRRVGQ